MLSWNVIPYHIAPLSDTDDMIEKATEAVINIKMAGQHDIIVITAGLPVRSTGTTNMIRVKKL